MHTNLPLYLSKIHDSAMVEERKRSGEKLHSLVFLYFLRVQLVVCAIYFTIRSNGLYTVAHLLLKFKRHRSNERALHRPRTGLLLPAFRARHCLSLRLLLPRNQTLLLDDWADFSLFDHLRGLR